MDKLPKVAREGTMEILGMKVRFFVLDDGRRILPTEEIKKVLKLLELDSDNENSN